MRREVKLLLGRLSYLARMQGPNVNEWDLEQVSSLYLGFMTDLTAQLPGIQEQIARNYRKLQNQVNRRIIKWHPYLTVICYQGTRFLVLQFRQGPGGVCLVCRFLIYL